MSSIFRRITNAVRLYRSGIIRVVFNRILPAHLQFQTYVLFDFDLKQVPAADWTEREDITFQRISSEEEPGFAAFRELFPDPVFLRRIRKEKNTCYLAVKDGEVVGYAWVSRDHLFMEAVNSRYCMEPGEIFIHACFVREAFRGQEIYPDMLRAILADHHGRGCCRACIGVLSNNTGSTRGIRKCGFREFRRITYLRVLNLEKRWGMESDRFAGVRALTAGN